LCNQYRDRARLFIPYLAGGHSLKIIDPLLRIACTESHHPIADRYKIYPPPIAEQRKVPPFADIQKYLGIRQNGYWPILDPAKIGTHMG
jgi:hypothetical protein